ncbi:phytanoyl-CoA dioxygenase family protein [Aquimarina hainanensis]|uniref:Phytanoyl-CoA dioxygenase family protein n=1 Tax=Aquimarina hainanensis TaxID=1578017 RepID=A0ABW5N6D4_9FLAO|nr:phytanoyl-CoA dioxygenase family protein [Aquimarina sp. TRL1]QKX05677.1 phytanoyl-CoA dioxygenase family protein [Aquimarina sp. TRL1]
MKNRFLTYGFSHLDALISIDEVYELRSTYNELLLDKKRTAGLRSDLSGGKGVEEVERITQIMRPSSIEASLSQSIAYQRALLWAKELLGEDMELDFDMMINKAPYTDTETPWHQDAAYWIDMPDKRAVSCWIALDDVYEDNGCMWFNPVGPDEGVLTHKALPNGGALYCDAETNLAQSIPLNPGGCTFHNGFVLHYSKGNVTPNQRRALILNFRPADMIALERKQGVDHTGKRAFRNKQGN